MPKLTKKYVDSLTVEKETSFFDDSLKGFGVRVWPTGRKVFILMYRTEGGRQRKMTLGPFGALTVDQARDKANDALSAARHGEDPASDKQEHRRGLTVADLAERYLDEYSNVKKKPQSARADKGLLDNHIKPAMGRLKISELTRAHVAKLHHDMRENPIAANRCLALLSHMFSMAYVWGIRPDGLNPCKGVKRFKEIKRERYLSGDEIKRLLDVLKAEADKTEQYLQSKRQGRKPVKGEGEIIEHPSAILALRLLLMTGCRLMEILTLKWSMVDLEQGILRLPDSKTGAKTVVLSNQAIELLKKHPVEKLNPYVCTGKIAGTHFVQLHTAWERIADAAEIKDCRLHDLRHSHASLAAASGMSLPMIGALLGHSQPSTTARYSHLALDALRAAQQAISDRIEELGKATPKVVSINSKR